MCQRESCGHTVVISFCLFFLKWHLSCTFSEKCHPGHNVHTQAVGWKQVIMMAVWSELTFSDIKVRFLPRGEVVALELRCWLHCTMHMYSKLSCECISYQFDVLLLCYCFVYKRICIGKFFMPRVLIFTCCQGDDVLQYVELLRSQ